MAKGDDEAEYEQSGGADWLLSQLRGDRAAENEKARDAAAVADAAERPDVTADPFTVVPSREPIVSSEPEAPPAPEMPAKPTVPVAPEVASSPDPVIVPDVKFVPADTMMPADAFLPAERNSDPVSNPVSNPVSDPASESATDPASESAEAAPYDSPSDRLPFWRRPAAEHAPVVPVEAPAQPVAPEPATPEPATPSLATPPPVRVAPGDYFSTTPAEDPPATLPPARERVTRPRRSAEASSSAEPAAAAAPAGGFQWGLTPSDEPDPVVASGPAVDSALTAPAPAPAPAVAAAPSGDLAASHGEEPEVPEEPEVRLAPQTEEPAETAVIELSADKPAPFEPRSASESVNAVREEEIEATAPETAPSEFFDAVAATPDLGLELPDALADAMALPDGEPGAAAFGRPAVVPLGGVDDGIDWLLQAAGVEPVLPVDTTELSEGTQHPEGTEYPEATEPIDLVAPSGATPPAGERSTGADFTRESPGAALAPAATPTPVQASHAAPVSAVRPAVAQAASRPEAAPAVNAAGGGGGGSSTPPVPGAGVPKPVLWLAGVLLLALVLVGLFFLGTRLGGGVPIAAPSPTPSSSASADASAEPPVAVLPEGTQPAGEHEWSQLGGGECIQPFTSVWDESFTVVDCAEPHAAQLVLRSNYGDNVGIEFPGEAAFAEQITAACTAPGVIDLAAAAPFGDVQVQGSYPVTEEQWTSGAAAYFCFVNRSSGEPLTGTLVPAS